MSRNKKLNTLPVLAAIVSAIFISVAADAYGGYGHVNAELPKEDLRRLNNTIKAADSYMREETKELDSLTARYTSLSETDYLERWKYAQRLTEDYLPIRADSSLRYSELAILIAREGHLKNEEYRSRIARINALSTAGIFTRALDEFRTIGADSLDASMRIPYWMAGRKLFGYMRAYVEGDRQFFTQYTERYYQYDDSLTKHLPVDDPTRTFYMAERLVSNGKFADAKKMLQGLCSSLPEESNLYGMAAFQLGEVYKAEGDQTAYASYLAKAAISDIKGCVKDGLALPALADWLYKQGEFNDAFRYINFALEDAMSGNVRMRTVTIAALLPLIDEAYRKKINASRDELMIYFLLVTVLFILSVGLMVVLMRMFKRSRANAVKLRHTARLQESYIGHFVGLCSTYANRLQSLQKLVTRKVASGQSEELLGLIKSGKYADDKIDEFYKVFDSAVLDIYPDFISNINALLRPEEQIELRKGSDLTPELRIYAIVRLGVDESTRIAQILNYSVSTVYAYRNRMRNRAIDRDKFDEEVMNIGNPDEENAGSK